MHPRTSWAKKILKDGNGLFGLTYPHEHAIAWYIILVSKPKIAAFKNALSGHDPVDLSDYGNVITKGWGTLPHELYDYVEAHLDEFVH